jgi:hypothetical protein
MLSQLCRLRLIEAGRGMLPRFVGALAENDASFNRDLSRLEKLLPSPGINAIALERAVAACLLKFGRYPLPAF